MALCELESIRGHEAIADGDYEHDELLGELIVQVSEGMTGRRGFNHPILKTTATAEKLDSIGDTKIYTRYSPVISITTLTENLSELVEDTDFECLAPDKPTGRITRISGGLPAAWARGSRIIAITYKHGYAAVPGDIERACIKQVVHEWKQSKASGAGRLGLTAKAMETGGSLAFERDGWLPSVQDVINHYRRGPY